MLWFVTIAAPVLMLGLLGGLYAAWVRFTGWTPVAARVVATDYSEAERRADRPWGWSWGVRPWHALDWRYGDGDRWTRTTFAWADADGREHRATHGCMVPEGAPEEAAHLLWVDPADPARTTLTGPITFLFLAGGCAAGLATLWTLARHAA